MFFNAFYFRYEYLCFSYVFLCFNYYFSNTTDNTGSRASGYNKNTASINLSNPFGIGEQFNFQNVKSQGTDYFSLNNSYPIGYEGSRISFKGEKMRYKLRAPYSSTSPTGFSTEFSSI